MNIQLLIFLLFAIASAAGRCNHIHEDTVRAGNIPLYRNMAFAYYLRNKIGCLKIVYYICVKNTQIKKWICPVYYARNHANGVYNIEEPRTDTIITLKDR